MTTREKIIAAAKEAGFDDHQWESMTYDSGPYEVATPKIALERFYTTAFDAGQESLRQQLADSQKQVTLLRDALDIAYDHLLVHWTEDHIKTVVPLNKIHEALAATEQKL
jgi:NifB/MoaA-like Fe-S oxidoreductase